MAKCSFAIWRPLPENWTEPHITATQFVYHTQVGYFNGLYSWFKNGTNAESHFGASMSGILEQYVDTSRQADAQYRANVRAISLECEDKGNPDNPYTDPQLEIMVRLGRWAMEHHPILPQVCPSWSSSGFGYHSMWGAPSNWTPARGKTCPGPVRIEQLQREVFPALLSGVTMAKKPVAIVVKNVNGLDAGVGHVLQSRLSTLMGMEVPVVAYENSKDVIHAIIVGDSRGMELDLFDSYTIYQGEDRIETGKTIDRLLGGR